MKSLIKKLSVLVSACLAADNNTRHDPINTIARSHNNAVNKDNALEPKDNHKTVSNHLQSSVDFGASTYFSDLKSKQVSIEAASQMSNTELNSLESDSDAFAS